MTPRNACRIVGVGQRLAGDDGVGPAVIDHLRRSALPPGITIGEVREPSALIPMLAETQGRLIVVDAVLADPPGEVLALEAGALEARGLASVSSHGVSVGQALALARATLSDAAAAADVRVVAVTTARPVRGTQGLSPAVAACVPRAALLALELATQRSS
jgi:hydrogenase maturation protease